MPRKHLPFSWVFLSSTVTQDREQTMVVFLALLPVSPRESAVSQGEESKELGKGREEPLWGKH